MKRLADLIIDKIKRNDDGINLATRDCIESAQFIVIDNVAHYYFGEDPLSFEYIDKWDRSDFPNVAPVFNNMFIEWSVPRTFKYIGKAFVGLHILSEKTASGWRSVFIEYASHDAHDDSLGTDVVFEFEINEAGIVVDTKNLIVSPRLHKHLGDINEISQEAKLLLLLSQNVYPALLAISFMHCKNVTLKKQAIPKGLVKKAQKKHGYTPVRYHVLDIEPMKKVLRYEGNAEKTGLKMALHICRGHFKDYSKGSGLFGKYQGLYWWDSHVRGSIEEGVVVKDYNVNPPS